MNKAEWTKILKEYNRELMSYESIVETLSRDEIKVNWLGFSPASKAKISALEKRLKVNLPPSYKAFLTASNGWRFPSKFIFKLRPAEEIAWFCDQNQDWIDAFVEPCRELTAIQDADYFNYGENQDSCKFRVEYLQTALQISDEGDSAVVLLNPEIVTADGEWECWLFANWLPGARRYRSFTEWLEHERKFYKQNCTVLSPAQVRKYVANKKPVSVRKAQEAARRGETEIAVASLEEFAALGDDGASASLAELHSFLGNWDKVITFAGRLISNPQAVYGGKVFDDMIRLLGLAGHKTGGWQRVIQAAQTARIANEREKQIGDRERNEKVFRNLIKYAKRKGKPPHELLAIFNVRDCMAKMSDTQRKAWYKNAVNNMYKLWPNFKHDRKARNEHMFSLATSADEEEALRLYEAHGKNFAMGWDAAVYAARAYLRRDNGAAAWSAIESNIGKWWPVNLAQVAPVNLLTDEGLSQLMTPARCEFVLSAPRGWEGPYGNK